MTIAKTARTYVERVRITDAPFFLALVNTPDFIRYIGNRNVSSLEDARRYLEGGFLRSYEENGFGYYIIRTLGDDQAIGVSGFLKKPFLDNPDFGFALLPKYYQQGYAAEYCEAVLDYGVKTFGFQVLDAVTTLDNVRSMTLLDRLGFVRLGTVSEPDEMEALTLYRREFDSS